MSEREIQYWCVVLRLLMVAMDLNVSAPSNPEYKGVAWKAIAIPLGMLDSSKGTDKTTKAS